MTAVSDSLFQWEFPTEATRHEFAIFWPEDAHKPCCNPGDASVSYRKLVFKVAL